MSAPVRALFATDLDGTLVDREDGIHPRDREAIRRARAAGIAVTIATGRLTSRTHPVARDLGLIDAPLVCADGSVLACPSSERVLLRRAIPAETVEIMLTAFARHGLSSFVFTHEVIHSCERGRAHHAHVRGWSSHITWHADVLRAEAWRSDPDAAVMVVGIGPDEDTLRVEAELEPLPDVEVLGFALGGMRAVRFLARGASKGTGLEEVARRLGLARDRVAVIGDWYNDVSMFAWATRSFAMPHAPDDVKATATDVLPVASTERGAIADALDAWLAELDD